LVVPDNFCFAYLAQFAAILSLHLAIINFIPFPALDGGRVLFLIIEKFKGSPVRQKTETIIHNIGFILLIGLIIIVTFKDIIKLF
jgi:regulator of sigma E protease